MVVSFSRHWIPNLFFSFLSCKPQTLLTGLKYVLKHLCCELLLFSGPASKCSSGRTRLWGQYLPSPGGQQNWWVELITGLRNTKYSSNWDRLQSFLSSHKTMMVRGLITTAAWVFYYEWEHFRGNVGNSWFWNAKLNLFQKEKFSHQPWRFGLFHLSL